MSSEISTRNRRGRRAPRAAAVPRGRLARAAAPAEAAVVEAVPQQEMRAWHLFLIGSLLAASAAALVTHGTRPANTIFVVLAVFVAGGTGYALYRTLWPLVGADGEEGPEMLGGRTRAALEREKFLALRAIKDLEFDRAMGKVSEADFEDMIARLRARAVRIIRQLDTGAQGYRELIEREVSVRLGRQPDGIRDAAGRVAGSPGDAGANEHSAAPASPDTAVAAPGARVSRPADDVVVDDSEAGAAGSRSVKACAGCGVLNDADARFCKGCGARLPAMAP